jgi:hypothetical protein
VALSENGSYAVAGYGRNLVLLVPDVERGSLNMTPFEIHALPVTAVALFPGGR